MPSEASADEHVVDLFLGHGRFSGTLAGANIFALRPGEPEEFLVGEKVVDHRIRPLKSLLAFEGQQARITRTCANEIDFAFHKNL